VTRKLALASVSPRPKVHVMNSFKECGEQLLRRDPAAADLCRALTNSWRLFPTPKKVPLWLNPIFAFFEAHPLDAARVHPELLYIC
jgi:hypothetical protein